MIEDNSNKEKALAAALSQIERQFGKGSMMRLGDTEREAIPAISTGSLGLDICLLYTSPSPRDRTRSRMPSSA